MVRNVILAVAAASVAISADAQPAGSRTADRARIAANEEAWGGAFVSGNVAVVKRLLAEDFRGVSSSGQVYDKAGAERDVAAKPRISSNSTNVESVRFYGNVAVAQGRDRVVGAAPQRKSHEMVWSDVWVKRNGGWQIVSAEDVHVGSR